MKSRPQLFVGHYTRMDRLRDMQAASADLGRDDRSQGACVGKLSALAQDGGERDHHL
jgi:hypothetical protein